MSQIYLRCTSHITRSNGLVQKATAIHKSMEGRHSGERKMATARRRRRRECCFVGATLFSVWGTGGSSSSAVSAFGFGGGLSQHSLSRSLGWMGEAIPSRGARSARRRPRTPPSPAEGDALSATGRRTSAFVVEGRATPVTASTTTDWRDLSKEVSRT